MKKTVLIALIIFAICELRSQTSEQAKAFINKTNIAINKVQKEILGHNAQGLDVTFKKAIRNQAIAIKLYKENKLKEAAEYSYRSRIQSVELLEGLNKASINFFALTDEDKTFIQTDPGKFSSKSEGISESEGYKIDHLDVFNIQKLHEIELSIN
jgi:hypothetical protein